MTEKSWTAENLLIRAAGPKSDTQILSIRPEDVGLEYVGLTVLRLHSGQIHRIQTDADEAVVLPLSGSYELRADGIQIALGGRSSVFEAVTDFAYLPIDCEVELECRTAGEIAMPTARATHRLSIRYGRAETVPVEVRGAASATRQINNFCMPGAFVADKLMSVEVLTPAGNFSSYPPHKHDRIDSKSGELRIEEIYYFRFRGASGYGLYRQYSAEGDFDVTTIVRDGDVFLVPKGYHGPSVAVPGHDMYFLNVMAGPAPERKWSFSDDPSQHWVRESWENQAPDPRLPMTSPIPSHKP